MNIFSVSPSFCFSIRHLYMSSIMLNVRPQRRKIANATPYFPSTENSVFQTVISVPRDGNAKCPSPWTENIEHNSLFSGLHGRKHNTILGDLCLFCVYLFLSRNPIHCKHVFSIIILATGVYWSQADMNFCWWCHIIFARVLSRVIQHFRHWFRTGLYAYFSRYSYGMTSHHMTYTTYITWRLYTHLAALQTVCLLSSVGRAFGLE